MRSHLVESRVVHDQPTLRTERLTLRPFIDHDAFQCGYCTPGQICSAVGLISECKAKTAEEIRELMSGNICRCGAYPNIVAAVKIAAAKMKGEVN